MRKRLTALSKFKSVDRSEPLAPSRMMFDYWDSCSEDERRAACRMPLSEVSELINASFIWFTARGVLLSLKSGQSLSVTVGPGFDVIEDGPFLKLSTSGVRLWRVCVLVITTWYM